MMVVLFLAGCHPGSGPQVAPPLTAPAPVRVRPFAMGVPDALLLVTGGTEGVLEVCNCQGPMPGSLPRRGGLVHSYRTAFPNVLLVDLGDAFWIEPTDLRNPFLWRGYARMGYDAVVLGSNEWAMDAPRLGRLIDETGLTALASVRLPPDVTPATTLTRTSPSAKVAVLADVRPSALMFVPPDRRERMRVASQDELGRQVRLLKQDGFVVVVALHGSSRDVAPAGDLGADLILCGHTRESSANIFHVDGTPVVKVGGYTEVGVVALRCDGPHITDLEFRLETVDARWPVDARILDVYREYARTAMRAALAAPRTKGLDYVPSSECGRCHEDQYKAWRTTRHAYAYETLRKVDRTIDPDCVRCHTTGFATEKGFTTIEETPAMAGVNCQDCHRFGTGEHLADDWKGRPVAAEVCAACHTLVTDPEFSFDEKRAKMGCPRMKAPPPRQLSPATARVPGAAGR